MGIVADVIETLTAKTAEAEQYNKEIEQQQALIDGGHLNAKGIEASRAAIREATSKRDAIGDRATEAVNAMLKDFVAQQAKLDVLNPDELTDDAKLFNMGVKLSEKQVTALLDKNSSNRTMVQLILQYAKENDIKLPNTYITAEGQAQDTARNIQSIARLYTEHWINHKNAIEMLHKLFQV